MVREIRSLRRARRLAGLLCAVCRSRPRWKDGARLYLISQTVISRPLRPARMCGPAGSDQVARQVRAAGGGSRPDPRRRHRRMRPDPPECPCAGGASGLVWRGARARGGAGHTIRGACKLLLKTALYCCADA